MSDRIARDIEILAEMFRAGGWAESRVESEAVSLLLSTDETSAPLGGVRSAQRCARPDREPVAVAAMAEPVGSAPAASPVSTSLVSTDRIDPSWSVITAPNLGTFYRAPKPGAAPFVEVGQKVRAETEICLIEVMKLFTSVRAGIAGTVRYIAVADAELVDGGQALLYIERD